MLDCFKSTYFPRVIFAYINDQKILEIIKYSKKAQKKLGINLINYKLFFGKYIIHEAKERAKEYFCLTDKLIYEGDYFKERRNGNGREYDFETGKLIYEGEFLNGKRDGKGIEYYYNGNLKFVGEYKKGKRWNGNGYDRNNNIIYEIEKGKGFIKEYFNLKDALLFEGEYLNGERNGKGKEYNYNGEIIFVGEYLNGKRWNGNGYDTNGNIIYELNNGIGFVKENFNYSDNLRFEGWYINGERNSKCKVFYGDKLIFSGEYKDGKRNESGKEYDYNGNLIFQGEYLYNYRFKGKEYIQGKLVYEGDYLFGKKWNGKGYDKSGNIIYQLTNGKGNIKEYYYNGNIEYEGNYLNGKRNGKGKEYYSNGKLKYEGEYFNGEIVELNKIKKFDFI